MISLDLLFVLPSCTPPPPLSHTHTPPPPHTHTRTHTHTERERHTRTHAPKYTRSHTDTETRARSHTHTRTHAHTQTHTHAHALTHNPTLTHTHTPKHTHTHPNTHTHLPTTDNTPHIHQHTTLTHTTYSPHTHTTQTHPLTHLHARIHTPQITHSPAHNTHTVSVESTQETDRKLGKLIKKEKGVDNIKQSFRIQGIPEDHNKTKAGNLVPTTDEVNEILSEIGVRPELKELKRLGEFKRERKKPRIFLVTVANEHEARLALAKSIEHQKELAKRNIYLLPALSKKMPSKKT